MDFDRIQMIGILDLPTFGVKTIMGKCRCFFVNIPYMDPKRDSKSLKDILLLTGTPWKIDMEPTNHPFRKENDLPNLHDYVPC